MTGRWRMMLSVSAAMHPPAVLRLHETTREVMISFTGVSCDDLRAG